MNVIIIIIIITEFPFNKTFYVCFKRKSINERLNELRDNNSSVILKAFHNLKAISKQSSLISHVEEILTRGKKTRKKVDIHTIRKHP